MKKAVLAPALLMAAAVVFAGGNSAQTGTGSGQIPTITYYPYDATASSGIIGGYKGDFLASKGFKVDVWSFSPEKTNAILASGDLPDIMSVPDGNRDDVIKGGMLLKLDDLLDRMPSVKAFEPLGTALNYVRQFKSANTGFLYGLPRGVGDNNYKYTIVDSTDRRAVKLKWEVYEQIGAPRINNFSDLIDVMEKMLKAQPTAADGKPNYGTILNGGFDAAHWACMEMWFNWQGYGYSELRYMFESRLSTGELKPILTRDSLYYAGLRWYNAVNRRGLMDPDSINLDRPTQKVKVDAGYGMIPSGNLPGWNFNGYYEYYIPGTEIYYSTRNAYGGALIGINAKTKHVDASLAFLDTITNPDAQLVWRNGPEGDFWRTDGRGNAFFTDAGLAWIKANGNWPGYALKNGEKLELASFPWITALGSFTSFKDGTGNPRIVSTMEWKESVDINADNATFRKWQKTTGYNTWGDWLAKEKAYYSTGPLEGLVGGLQPSSELKLVIDALKDVVVNASWQMVYAKTDQEFNAIWDKMVSDCNGLGAQRVMDWRRADIENMKKITASLKN